MKNMITNVQRQAHTHQHYCVIWSCIFGDLKVKVQYWLHFYGHDYPYPFYDHIHNMTQRKLLMSFIPLYTCLKTNMPFFWFWSVFPLTVLENFTSILVLYGTIRAGLHVQQMAAGFTEVLQSTARMTAVISTLKHIEFFHDWKTIICFVIAPEVRHFRTRPLPPYWFGKYATAAIAPCTRKSAAVTIWERRIHATVSCFVSEFSRQ